MLTRGCLFRRGQSRSLVLSSRGYDEALQKLASIASNRRVTQLFESASPTPSADPNMQAIPEMLDSLRRAGYSPKDLGTMRHIHVAGTKGKGSVCAFATSLLTHQPQASPVGTYTSPHLVSPRERIAIDGRPVDKEVFARGVFEIWDRFTETGKLELGLSADEAEGPLSKPFYFRFMTILAWHIFITLGIKDVIMECGIGGEYDATNVIPPHAVSAAVITQLGIDHVAMLGDTAEKIAWHKAGILKKGVTAFTRNIEAQPGVMAVLKDRAASKGANLIEVDDDLVDSWGGVDGRLKGAFQPHNQALALLAVRQHLGLKSSPRTSLETMPPEMAEGLRQAHLRGRCEIIRQNDMTWFLDGAHTKESLEQVAWWIGHTIGPNAKCVLVFNQQERDASHLLEHLVGSLDMPSIFSHAIFTRNDQAAGPSHSSEYLVVQKKAQTKMKQLIPSCKTHVLDNIESSVQKARECAIDTGGLVLVTGSLHLVGGVLQALEPGTLT